MSNQYIISGQFLFYIWIFFSQYLVVNNFIYFSMVCEKNMRTLK